MAKEKVISEEFEISEHFISSVNALRFFQIPTSGKPLSKAKNQPDSQL